MNLFIPCNKFIQRDFFIFQMTSYLYLIAGSCVTNHSRSKRVAPESIYGKVMLRLLQFQVPHLNGITLIPDE